MKRLLLAGLLALAACGYSTGRIVPGDGRSIRLEMFGNRTFRRDIERDLTRLVAEEIRSRSGFRLADDDGPDLVLTGTIVNAEEQVLSERDAGRIRESSVILAVEIVVTDARTGEILRGPERITRRSPFTPVKAESIRTAELAAMREIAERIVYTLARDW